MPPTSAELLKSRHRLIRDGQPEALRLRIHRALSWLIRAEREQGDPDARFVFQWVALNAAYAQEFGHEQRERDMARVFIEKLLAIDHDKRLHAILFAQFSGSIRTLIENKFVFDPFWKALRDHDGSSHWEERFAASKQAAMKALLGQQTDVVLSIILDRLYVLRNQLVHGGSTWNSATNRVQVRDGANLLGALLPTILDLMMQPDAPDLGSVTYPVV